MSLKICIQSISEQFKKAQIVQRPYAQPNVFTKESLREHSEYLRCPLPLWIWTTDNAGKDNGPSFNTIPSRKTMPAILIRQKMDSCVLTLQCF